MTGPSRRNQNSLLQPDFLSFRDYTTKKFQSMEEMFHSFIEVMTNFMKQHSPSMNNEFENPFGDPERRLAHSNASLFKDPNQAERARRNGLSDGEDETHNEPKDTKNGDDDRDIKHLKLSFQVYKDGEDAPSWVRDWEEFFSVM